VGRTNHLLSFCYIHVLNVWDDTDRIKNDTCNSFVVVCVFVAMVTCLASHCYLLWLHYSSFQALDTHTHTQTAGWSHNSYGLHPVSYLINK
jgi:hypothetical protein